MIVIKNLTKKKEIKQKSYSEQSKKIERQTGFVMNQNLD